MALTSGFVCLLNMWIDLGAASPTPTQNVLAVVDFDLHFTYVLAGWEGSAKYVFDRGHSHFQGSVGHVRILSKF